MRDFQEEQLRNIYLRKLLVGELQGPLTGKPSVDKPHLKFYSEEAFSRSLPKTSIYNYMYEINKNHLDDIAFVFDTGFDETEITYGELFKNIDTVANGLVQRGIKVGDKVAVSFANTPESVYTIYAINKIGAVSCLIDPRIKTYNLERDLKDLDVKMFIGNSEVYKNLKKVAKKVNLDNIVIIPTIQSATNKKIKNLYLASKILTGNHPLKLNKNWSSFLAENKTKKETKEFEYKEDQLAIISYTGGTTGVHKGVMLSNEAFNNLMLSHDYLMEDLGRGEKFMNILPQFMVYGIFTLHLALCRGLKTHLLLDSAPEHFVDNLIRLNPAISFGGPIHWETLIDNPKITPNCFSNMKAPVSGGEKLSLAKELAISKALKYGGSQEEMCNGLGASELAGSSTWKQGSKNKSGTVGRLHVYDNAKIVDSKTGEELSYNQPGELWLTSPSLMSGYYHREDETKHAIHEDEDGVRWFITGDLAQIDENGDIDLTGRSKRLFVCGLNNVYPPELEEIIYTIPSVNKCAVTNVPDEELRAVPKVHLVLNEDTEANRKKTIASIQTLISERVGSEVLPHYYEFHDHLKYTLNGKIDIEAIRRDDLEKIKANKEKKVLRKK